MLKLDLLFAFLTLVKADFCKNKTSNLALLLCYQEGESAVCKGVVWQINGILISVRRTKHGAYQRLQPHLATHTNNKSCATSCCTGFITWVNWHDVLLLSLLFSEQRRISV